MTQSLDLADYLPYLLNRVGAALVESFTRDALAQENLGISMWRVLAALSSGGEQRQIDISAMTSIEVSTLSRLVTRLVARGLVTRQRSRASNREVIIALSQKGRTLAERLVPIARKLERKAHAGLSAQELAATRDVLRRMHANMTAPDAAGR